MTHHLSGAYLKRLLQFGQQSGSVPAMARPFMQGHSGQRVHVNLLCALMDSLCAQHADATFGLRFGLSLDTHAFGFLGYLAQVAPDLRRAMDMLIRYEVLASSAGSARFHQQDQLCHLQWHPHVAEISASVSDAFLGGWYACASQITGRQLPLTAVHRRQTLPTDILRRYETLWQTTVVTGQKYDALVFDPEFLSTPSQFADPVMYETLLQESERLKRLLSHQSDMMMHIQTLTIAAIRQGDVPSLKDIAAQLELQPFKLQRLLKTHNSTFSRVLDEAKYSLACEWLAHAGMSLSGISERLGFSEPSAFSRAFKRWSTMQPNQYRHQIGLEPKH